MSESTEDMVNTGVLLLNVSRDSPYGCDTERGHLAAVTST